MKKSVVSCLFSLACISVFAQDPAWYKKGATPQETFRLSYPAAMANGDFALGPWHLIGPFANELGNKGFDVAYPPEKGVDLNAEYDGVGGKRVRWQRKDTFRDGVANDLRIFDVNDFVCAYVYREITSPVDQQVMSEMGSDDTLTVWVNGEKIFAKNVLRSCKPGEEKIMLPLKAGKNQLLLKICQGDQGWGFAFGLAGQSAALREALALIRRDFPNAVRDIELLEEAMMQYDRLDGLLTGRIPKSKFAVPQHTHNAASLFLPEDKDPADVVIRRTRALCDALKSPLKAELDALVAKGGDRLALYLAVCDLRRRVAFSNPLLDFDKVVFITHKKNARGELGGDHMAGQYYGIHATKGEGLFILDDAFGKRPAARNVIGEKAPDGAYLSPDLSYDGKRILFAYTEAAGYAPERRAAEDADGMYNYSGLKCSFTDQNAWHIYSVNADGTGLRQLTRGVFNDFDPCWLPNGKIAFISDRRGGFGRCHMTANGGAPWFTYTLHRMNADGSGMERLSHHETCEWQPSVLNDGMIVYTRWDYVDRGFFQAHHPWTTTPDGRNALAIHGNYPKEWQDRPCMEMDIRAIPGSRKMVAVATAHHGQTYGSIVLVDPDIEDDDAMAPVKMITPDERMPETEYGYFCREASYATPFPLSEDYYLCAFGYPSSAAPDSVENYGLYLLDAFGNIELLYRDPAIASQSPIPLRPTPVPPVVQETVQPYQVAQDQPRANYDRPGLLAAAQLDPQLTAPPATVSIMNIYESRHAWPEGAKITALRIIQILPKSTPGRNNPAIGYGTEKNARAVLGTVPVEADGSVHFQLPPYIPVLFQALDADGKAVESMRSDVYAAPRENLSCVGCHENRRAAPTLPRTTLATQRPPSKIQPEPDGTNPFSYPRLVQPVLDKHCAACHATARADGKKAPDLSGKPDGGQWTPSYRDLRPFAFYYDGGGSFVESKTYPGKFGAIASPLYKHLAKGHKDVKLTPDEMRRITLWLDCNSDFYGTYENIESQRRGEIVRAIMQ
ncbi:MAG: hypothetical protein FWG50_09900 [Kiritimatiellaeota bacterium]|nr:hypothetical protein [Kiritimatiellota bacterium]